MVHNMWKNKPTNNKKNKEEKYVAKILKIKKWECERNNLSARKR